MPKITNGVKRDTIYDVSKLHAKFTEPRHGNIQLRLRTHAHTEHTQRELDVHRDGVSIHNIS